MASVFKAKGERKYTILYFDEDGRRRKTKGCSDKAESERIAADLENQVAVCRAGLVDRKAEAYRDHEAIPLARHISDWQADLIAKGHTSKHAEHTSNRVRRLVTVALGCPLAVRPKTARARGKERDDPEAGDRNRSGPGLSAHSPEGPRLACPLPRLWRIAPDVQPLPRLGPSVLELVPQDRSDEEDELRGVTGFNAREDRRQPDRRTLRLDELHRLIDAIQNGPVITGIPGPD